MFDDYSFLLKNKTWKLVPYTPEMHVEGHKWVYKIKLNPDGSLQKLMARFTAKGFQ